MLRSVYRAILGVALLVVSAPLTAQKTPKRLDLKFVADTNDALGYLTFGQMNFAKDPEKALSAFYWASRIDPGSADAYYGRWAATLLNDRYLLNLYETGGRKAFEDKELRKADSLQLRALMLNPFLRRQFDRQMFVEWVIREDQRNGGNASAELRFVIERYLSQADPVTRAWVAASDGDLAGALSLYAIGLKQSRFKSDIHVGRARIFAIRNEPDSAIASFQAALEAMRKLDAKEKVSVYVSKALFEHSIGLVNDLRDRRVAAREGYGRALQEDLAFYPAHLRLGLLAVDAGDTTTALSELALAAQAAPTDGFVRYQHATVLSKLGRLDEATAELNAVIALEPYYALPRFELAQVLDKRGEVAAARAAYQAFLDRASEHLLQRPVAIERLAALAGK